MLPTTTPTYVDNNSTSINYPAVPSPPLNNYIMTNGIRFLATPPPVENLNSINNNVVTQQLNTIPTRLNVIPAQLDGVVIKPAIIPMVKLSPSKSGIIPTSPSRNNIIYPNVTPINIHYDGIKTNTPANLVPTKPSLLVINNPMVKQLTLRISVSKSELVDMGMKYITEYQKQIIQECMEKGSGGLSLPMGTGKTLISILVSLMQCNTNNSKILVIVSKSLITTWKEELIKFFGNSINYEIYHREFIKDLANWTPKGDIVITTPEVISKIYTKYNVENFFSYTLRPEAFAPETKYYRVPYEPYLNYPSGDGFFYSLKWGAIIVDEAHNYLKPTTARNLAIASLCAKHRWLLSGTLLAEPKHDKLFGYHLLLNYHDSPRNFPEFKIYIDSEDYVGIAQTFVRREGNVDFIPPKINKEIISHNLSETEALIYMNVKEILNILKTKLKEYKNNGDKVNTKKFSSYIMGMISHMRQCLVCPLIPITTVAIDVADFEQRSELSDMFMNHINGMGINDWLNDVNSLYSSRIRAVCNQVNKHPNERIIIFSCYRTVLDVMKLYLPKDRPIFTISGNNKIDTRTSIIDNYRLSSNGILLLTYEIGANGLNLQCSSVAMLVDFWWNAGKSEQAITRLLRPGQQADEVYIYYFTANSGMENALFKLQTSKIAMGEEILNGHMTTQINKIRTDDIIRLINTDDNIDILTGIINK